MLSLLGSLLSSLGDLASTDGFLTGCLLDDTDSDGLSHVSNGETTKRGVLREDFDDHRLLGDHLNHGGIAGLDAGRVLLSGFTGTLVNLVTDLAELAGDVGGVAIENGGIAVLDLTGVVKNDDLGNEHFSVLAGVVLGVRADVASLDILDGQVLDVETNVVSGNSLIDHFVMHFDGLDFSGHCHGAEGDDHAGLEGTGLDSADWDSADTSDLVDVLEGETEGLVGGSLGGGESIEGLEEEGTLVPGHLVGVLDHVITVPS